VRRLVDVTLTMDDTVRGVEIRPVRLLTKDGWNTTTLSLYSHCGTHVDAPRHFLPDGVGIDRQDLSVRNGPARVINLVPIEPCTLITRRTVGDNRSEKPGVPWLPNFAAVC